EQIREVEECVAWSGRRPIEWLLENEVLGESWCLVHATHATDAELVGIAARRVVVGLCPITESSLGDGIFPAARFLRERGRIAIGSDSNILLDAAAELRTLEYSQRLAQRARNVLAAGANASTGRSLFDAALAAGRQALQGADSGAGANRARALPAAVSTGAAGALPPAGASPAAGVAAGSALDVVPLSPARPAPLARPRHGRPDSWLCA